MISARFVCLSTFQHLLFQSKLCELFRHIRSVQHDQNPVMIRGAVIDKYFLKLQEIAENPGLVPKRDYYRGQNRLAAAVIESPEIRKEPKKNISMKV